MKPIPAASHTGEGTKSSARIEEPANRRRHEDPVQDFERVFDAAADAEDHDDREERRDADRSTSSMRQPASGSRCTTR